MKYRYLLSFLLLLFFCLSGCSESKERQRIISVTIEPQRYFAERIAGDLFKIHTVVPVGQSPETYDPTPREMMAIGKSIAYFQIGYIGFEQVWMETIRENNSGMEIFDLSEGIELIETMNDCTHTHHHTGKEEHIHHHHHHVGIDPHTWSCVAGARMIAWNTLNAFLTLDEKNSQFYWTNYNQLLKEIDDTEAEISHLLQGVSPRTFIIYHPALTYFANENNLTQLCIEMEGKEPSPAQLREIIDVARETGTKVVFVQQEFDQKNASLIAKETACQLITINPLAYDWKDEMIRIAKALANE